jgi:DNA-binding NtrC family response regulator
MKEKHVLFAWIGHADREAAGLTQAPPDIPQRKAQADGPGPIARTLLEDSVIYEKAVLLSDKEDKDKDYKTWLNGELQSQNKSLGLENIHLEPYNGNPMDRQRVYEASETAVKRHAPTNKNRTYLLSAGTSVMHACLMLLAYTEEFKARMVDAAPKEKGGVKEVSRWREIAHFAPSPPANILELMDRQYDSAKANSSAAAQLIGDSPRLKEAIGLANLIAQAPAMHCPALILGATGTGKELLAKIVHELSQKRGQCAGEFVSINCAAIPSELLESELFGYERGAHNTAKIAKRGRVEEAENGVLFLDEIGDMPLSLQAKLLRFLSAESYGSFRRLGGTGDRTVKNVRIVAATHKNLLAMIEEGSFREDMYHRLSKLPIKLPSLWERLQDIAPLSKHFIATWNQKNCGPSGEGLQRVELVEGYLNPLLHFHWPGNVRQLKNVIERAAMLANLTSARMVGADIIERALIAEKTEPNPFSPASILEVIAAENGLATVEDTLLDRARYFFYRKLLDYQRASGDKRIQERQWLEQKMGRTGPTLRGDEERWEALGDPVDSGKRKKKL